MKQLYFILIIVLLASCQDEEFFEQVEDTTSLSSQSELSNLISRLTQNPTAFDDFIDNTNSLRLEFPFEVILNSETTFIITEFDDYRILIDELTDIPNDYEIDITFPVDISLPNYELISVENQAEFETVNAGVEGSTEINCLEYNYPLNINIFDANNGFTNSRAVQNRAQLYNLTQSLKLNNSFYQIIYPINIFIEGQNESITSNLELNAAIQNLDSECFNPSIFDDNDSSRLQQFITFITSGEFRIITYINDDAEDQTLVYEDYRFTFNTDNTIFVENLASGDTFTGDWLAEIDDDELVFEIDIEESDVLEELDEDWFVEAFANPSKIELIDEDDDSGEQSLLTFEKI
ncbi:hypothetical protein [Psychroflexus lacisalsi]|uniref:DUF1735 domain-containing protein n=1 Tax=Psychroflexus lacisalsi TaxID=503928 RepID=A0ABP3VM54_9FLAO|nr:hypothetical protein [Psychroflexus lacisalsi]MBZ9620314.1 hypothetical protein [Psychroflexus lacisalsi]